MVLDHRNQQKDYLKRKGYIRISSEVEEELQEREANDELDLGESLE